MKGTMTTLVAAAALLAPATAAAHGTHPPYHPTTPPPYHPTTPGHCGNQYHPCPPPGTTPPPNHPTGPPPQLSAPPVSPNGPVEGFCMQTTTAGETFVQANAGSFDPGGDWYSLWSSQTPVTLDGQVLTPQFENGRGVILAALVPGVGLTCAQPYVSTDGVYQNPGYGLRGAAWQQAFPGQNP